MLVFNLIFWIKDRSEANNHELYDAVRGLQKEFQSDLTNAEDTNTAGLTAFDSDGFTARYRWSSYIIISMLLGIGKQKTTGSANTDGTITSTVSANTTAGFSIVKYTGTGSAATVGHGLGVVPKFLITKALNDGRSWLTYNATDGSGKGIDLNGTGASNTNSAYWNNTTPTTSVVSLGGNVQTSGSYDYIMYCFAEKQGFSKFGSYTGNGNADGTFVYTGFKPAMVIYKRSDGTEGWLIQDNRRPGYNPMGGNLFPNVNNAESTDARFDFLSNGFKARSGNQNTSGSTHIYMAFASAPLVGSNNVPCTAR